MLKKLYLFLRFRFEKTRQAAAKALKRNKWSTSDSERNSDSEHTSGSEFKMSDAESEISEEHSDSNQSSDS
ncbi:hypothetical protein QE152_g9712 [Popillia japonica]|uniref:Uncharacterized protein n=1 Tax=Popillia japonica TaxID=7064 RepID=A0AAW1LU00_POPJA